MCSGFARYMQDRQHRGQAAENPTRQPALGRVRPDLPLEPEPFPYDRGDLVEHLGQVSPALLLNQDRRDQDPDVLDGHARGQVEHRRPQLQAEILLFEALPELLGDGPGHLLSHRPNGGGETVAGPQGAHDQIQRLR